MIKYPSVIIEILSSTTESTDRGFKFQHYLRMSSLQQYVLISQNQCLVECYTRQTDSWAYRFFDTPNETLLLWQPELRIALSELYEGIEFPPIELPL